MTFKSYVGTNKSYVGTNIVRAEIAFKGGEPGYRIIYPSGHAGWLRRETFDQLYREITRHERQILDMTDAEAQVSAISDGDPDS